MTGDNTRTLPSGLVPLRRPPDPDVHIENHGSIWLLRPLNQSTRDWLFEHTADDALEFGGALVVEPRYVEPIIAGLVSAGFHVT